METGPSGLIETGGGRKDLTDKAHYFLALQGGDLPTMQEAVMDESVLIALNYLTPGENAETANIPNDVFANFAKVIEAGKRVYLDSGCFSLAHKHAKQLGGGLTAADVFMTSPTELPFFEDWLGLYQGVVTEIEDDLWGYVEVDFGNYEERTETRQRCWDESGLIPIPVYRAGKDPFDVFEDLLQKYDRICLAGTSHVSRNVRAAFYSAAYKTWQEINPDCIVHVLGVGAFGIFSSFNFPSCDSSTYANSGRFGLTCGYCYAGFSHAAHFVPRIPKERVRGEGEATYSHARRIGMLQHSLFNVGRREHLIEIEHIKEEYDHVEFNEDS